jgi:hypothetical protein
MWMGGGGNTLAVSLVTLIGQLSAAYPSTVWQNHVDTGTIGDATHQAEGSASDHNPWLYHTVRALDVANADPHGPDCEALFAMVNRMYAAKDSRVFPDGYAIYRGRITDWDNPGKFHAQIGDQHNNHVHISVSQTPTGYNSTAPWPLTQEVDDLSAEAEAMIKDLHDRLGKIDTMAFQVHDQLTPAVAAIRSQTVAIAAKLNSVSGTGSVDVTTLAKDLAAALGPQLGHELVAALGAALAAPPH